MFKPGSQRKRIILMGLALLGIIALTLNFHVQLGAFLQQAYHLLTSRAQMEAFVQSFGPWAPIIFMAVQIGQVILAPIPGEATGFLGGYLFGAGLGFVYSSLALAVGSWINFRIGRILGRRIVRRMIPGPQLAKLDRSVRHQGALVLFVLFLFPGFPKDYLSLFLGLTTLPEKIFLLMASVGRMPGTLMLSLQGALLYERMYGVFAAVLGICVVLAFLAYRHRERVYRWIDKANSNPPASR
jgi:uncharacterized membrane protein YdjX (TVP38/TMEM64 family)